MHIKTIPLSELEADLQGTLRACADSGQGFVIELPDLRMVSIQPFDSTADDSLTSELIESNPAFQAMVEKSAASPRKPFMVLPKTQSE